MTNHEEHGQPRPQDKLLSMPGFPFAAPANLPAERNERTQTNLAGQDKHHRTNLTAGQRRQATLTAIQQHRDAALAAQQRLANQRSLTDDQFRNELARIQRLCHQNRQDDTCPPECVVRQWRRGVPLGELNGMEAFRRRLNGGR